MISKSDFEKFWLWLRKNYAKATGPLRVAQRDIKPEQ